VINPFQSRIDGYCDAYDQPEHLFNSDDLRCTCSGQVLMDDDKAIPLPQIIAQESLSTTSWDVKTIRQKYL
jgi:hypothetical protein